MTTTVTEYIDRLTARFDSADLFYGHGTDNAADEAFYLVFAALDLPFGQATTLADRVLSEREVDVLDALADQRVIERVPVAYLVGQAWFAGRAYHVGPEVLIPRSPIAELIEHRFQPLFDDAPERILDLCTGSGCIGISCALSFPEAHVDLADISRSALELAARNAERHGVADRTFVHESDLFVSLEGCWDLIVCNPPYVSQQEIDQLPREYHHEPSLGLLSDDDGLGIPLRILRQASAHLCDGGWLVLELGYSWSLLQQRYPALPLLWLEFDSGGEGVLAINRSQLQAWFG